VTTAALASAVLAATLTGCQFGEDPPDTSPIVIGADLELSGPDPGRPPARRTNAPWNSSATS
jgi:hypothetical protein